MYLKESKKTPSLPKTIRAYTTIMKEAPRKKLVLTLQYYMIERYTIIMSIRKW